MLNKGQIWIETVIYTLIGLAIIGILLSFITPAINEKKDEVLIEQGIVMLESINEVVEEIKFYGEGNSREINIKIQKGKLKIISENDSIIFNIESKNKFSEPGRRIEEGDVTILTEKSGNYYLVKLSLDYEKVDITFNKGEEKKTYQKSPSSYKIMITNYGKFNNKTNIDFS
jgi:hypothetical protein